MTTRSVLLTLLVAALVVACGAASAQTTEGLTSDQSSNFLPWAGLVGIFALGYIGGRLR